MVFQSTILAVVADLTAELISEVTTSWQLVRVVGATFGAAEASLLASRDYLTVVLVLVGQSARQVPRECSAQTRPIAGTSVVEGILTWQVDQEALELTLVTRTDQDRPWTVETSMEADLSPVDFHQVQTAALVLECPIGPVPETRILVMLSQVQLLVMFSVHQPTETRWLAFHMTDALLLLPRLRVMVGVANRRGNPPLVRELELTPAISPLASLEGQDARELVVVYPLSSLDSLAE